MATIGLDLVALADASLPFLRQKAPLFSAFTTNLKPTLGSPGEGIKVSYTNAQTASLFGTSYDVSTGTSTGVTLTFGQPFHRTEQFTPLDVSSYDESTFANQKIGPMIVDVLNECLSKTFTVATNGATIIAYTGSIASFGYDAAQTATSPLDTSGSAAPYFLLARQKVDKNIKKDLKDSFGASATVINGQITRGTYNAGDVTVVPAYGLPKGTYLQGIIGGQGGICVATRIPDSFGAEQAVATDPDTGLSVAIARWQDPARGLLYSVRLMFVAGLGRPGQLAAIHGLSND